MMFPMLLGLLFPVVIHSLLPADCNDIYTKGFGTSGVYTIYPGGSTSPAQVFCDMENEEVTPSAGKWTVIQRRKDGSVNFYRGWDQYKSGFGSAAGEYWLGLENMHLLTLRTNYELKVDMEDFEGNKAYAQYSSFSIDSESDGYTLHVGTFKNGEAGDSLSHHNEQKFTTFDKDQDLNESNCAAIYYGGFWYNNCHWTNPNGLYAWGESTFGIGINWRTWKEFKYSLKTITMKIRPVTT